MECLVVYAAPRGHASATHEAAEVTSAGMQLNGKTVATVVHTYGANTNTNTHNGAKSLCHRDDTVRRVVRGPATFTPDVGDRVHVFKWSDGYDSAAAALRRYRNLKHCARHATLILAL
jgi:hypothetical protein